MAAQQGTAPDLDGIPWRPGSTVGGSPLDAARAALAVTGGEVSFAVLKGWANFVCPVAALSGRWTR